jgi:hypothetical protein
MIEDKLNVLDDFHLEIDTDETIDVALGKYEEFTIFIFD